MLLALERVRHGEVVPWTPFLTAMRNPADMPVVIHEMMSVGTAMTMAIVGTWLTMLGLSRALTRRVCIPKPRITGAVPTMATEKS